MTSEQASIFNYSVVIPAYNEQGNIKPLLERIEKIMADVDGTYEIVIVDNGSFDGTPAILNELVGKYPSLVIVTLSRNFGYDGAITTGLEYARGSWVIIMDGDQQDPPEVIPQLIGKAKEGYDIVYGIRAKRTERWFLALQMKIFYRIWKKIVNINVPKDAGNFSIISREVVDIIKRMPERNKFIRGLRAWTGYSSTGLIYQREERILEETKFSFLAYLNHALNGITSFSTVPLRMFTYTGLVGLLMCSTFGLFFLLTKVFELLGFRLLSYNIPMGSTTLALLVLTAISINLLGFGIIGEYIGRIFEEVKNRPNFLVRKVVRSSDRKDSAKITVEKESEHKNNNN
jgi:dolichol-phosphate mannosyltransferase